MDSYIKFYAPITPNTAIQLQQHVEQLLRQGLTRLHLLLSTPGGSVRDGISVYNFLKALPLEVNTYNFGSVDSIGVVMFCAGNARYSVPHARFLLHPISMQMMVDHTFDEPLIAEKLNVLKSDQSNIANVIASTINKPVSDVFKWIHARTSLDPEQARNEGLVTEIKSSLIPAGAHLMSIYEPQVQQGTQLFQEGVPGFKALSIPDPSSQSHIPHTFTTVAGY
ncbi:MAG: hypothetical protein MdMp024_0253 [Bacteroidales bacterium]